MKTSDFDYELPPDLIAQTPMEPRDHSRLMVVSREDGSITHKYIYDLPQYLRAGDVLVFNDSRVMPARLHGRRAVTGGEVEVLLLHRVWPAVWRALVKPGRRMREGDTFEVSRGGAQMSGEVLEVEEDGSRLVRLSTEEELDKLGVVPLPPYIRTPLQDPERYQTVYAREPGSVAAPTAGLHFTPSLMKLIGSLGVELAFVTLHVGWDSFRPVKAEDPKDHTLQSEWYEMGDEAAGILNRAARERRRIVSVGTTAVRLLEHAALALRSAQAEPNTGDVVAAGSGWADLLIHEGHEFQVVDTLMTNFHLPRSTLLMLTSAFANRELVLQAYQEAAHHRYRFYSFGDAMLLV